MAGSGFAQLDEEEFRARRDRLAAEFEDGIVLLHARAVEAGLTDHGFKQSASFLYFSGLANQPSAILAVDGPDGATRLFVPNAPVSFGTSVPGVSLEPNESEGIRPFRDFTRYLRRRITEGAKVYLDEPRHPVARGNPDELRPLAGDHALFRLSLEEAFPSAEIASAASFIREMRWVKSKAEIESLRAVARASASALADGLRAVRPGVRQRVAEAAVVSGCVQAGAEGPSFWPWVMSGPNAHATSLVGSFYDYRHLDRAMQAGELARMDIGCDLGHYEGDVGRTVPVSGRFTDEQAEAWNLLVGAYRAGLAAIRDGATRASLAEASRSSVRIAEPSLKSDTANSAAREMLEGGDSLWHVHGVGLDAGEERVDPLRAGSVIAYEPGFSVGDDAYYLEDMILVTETGHEILTQGLPYTAAQIERAMAPN